MFLTHSILPIRYSQMSASNLCSKLLHIYQLIRDPSNPSTSSILLQLLPSVNLKLSKSSLNPCLLDYAKYLSPSQAFPRIHLSWGYFRNHPFSICMWDLNPLLEHLLTDDPSVIISCNVYELHRTLTETQDSSYISRIHSIRTHPEKLQEVDFIRLAAWKMDYWTDQTVIESI